MHFITTLPHHICYMEGKRRRERKKNGRKNQRREGGREGGKEGRKKSDRQEILFLINSIYNFSISPSNIYISYFPTQPSLVTCMCPWAFYLSLTPLRSNKGAGGNADLPLEMRVSAENPLGSATSDKTSPQPWASSLAEMELFISPQSSLFWAGSIMSFFAHWFPTHEREMRTIQNFSAIFIKIKGKTKNK